MPAENAPPKKERLIFIDVMRGIAVLWMIEAHVVDALLAPQYKTGFIYWLISLTNGFVAVSFIFCAGAGFWLAAMRKSDDWRSFKKPLFDYLRRLGVILVMAYWLHLPTIAFFNLFNMSDARWNIFAECDVLQTIVYTSLAALTILLIIPKKSWLPGIYIFCAAAIFLAAPIVWAADPFAVFPRFVAACFAEMPISKFPLLHWGGFFFAGAAITHFFMNAKDRKKFAWWLFLGGVAAMEFFYFTRDIKFYYPGLDDWWHVAPGHSLFRLSCAIWVFGLLYLLENFYKNRRIGNALTVSGQESLLLYLFHLMIVYGSVVNYGLKQYLGSVFDPFATALLYLAVTIFVYFTAKYWHILKAKNLRAAHIIMGTLAGLFLLVFFTSHWYLHYFY